MQGAFQGLLAGRSAVDATGAAPALPCNLDLRVVVNPSSPFTAGHRSRLGCMVIDSQTDDVFAAAKHRVGRWPPLQEGRGDRYRRLQTPASEVKVLDQVVEHPRRVQVDIEIDDIELKSPASNFRGARRVAFVQRAGGSWYRPRASAFAWCGPSWI